MFETLTMDHSNAKQHLDRVIPSSTFKLRAYTSNGFSIWKKEAGPFIAFGFLFAVLSMVVSVVPYVGSFINQVFISPALTAGAYIFSHKVHKKSIDAEFSDFFDGFKMAKEIILVYLLYSLISIVFLIPFLYSVGFEIFEIWGQTEEMSEYFMNFNTNKFWFLLPVFCVGIFFFYALQFVIFFGLGPIDALSYSAKLGMKHFFWLIIFIIIVSIIMMLGLIGIIIGIFITFPIMFPMFYESFRDLTQLDSYEQTDETRDVYNSLIS